MPPHARKLLFFFLAYLALAVIMFWPLARDLRAGIPHDVGDPILNAWILWWNAQAIPFTDRWWNGPAFWPLPNFMALSEHLVGISVLSTPLQWMGAGPQLTYNLVLLLSWPLSAVAAHILCWRLTGRHDAAVIGALVFGFSPYRLGQTPHIQVLASWWMPLALLALHRILQASSPAKAAPWLALFAASWLLQAFSNGYFLFYFSVLVGLWLLWFTARSSAIRVGLVIAAVWLAAGSLTVPVLLKYKAVHQYWNLTRGFDEITEFSGDVSSFVTAAELVRFWPFRPETRPEQQLYPGAAAALMLVAGLGAAIVSIRTPSPWRRAATAALLAVGSLFLLAALASFAFGEWELQFGPIHATGRRAGKPLTNALACFLAAGMFDPRFRHAFRSRSPLAFYTLAALVAFAMCLGPTGRLMGEQIVDRPPYWWLMKVPGVDNLRVPTRFMMVAVLSFAVAVSLAFARLTRQLPRRAAIAAVAAAIAAVLADSWATAIPMHAPREQYALPETLRDTSVIELPLGEIVDDDIAAMSRGMSHGRPVANGYTGYFPGPYQMLIAALRERDRSALSALATFGRLCVVIDGRLPLAAESRALTESSGGRLAGTDRDYLFYTFERQQVPADRTAAPISIRRVVPEGWTAPAPSAADGRYDTWWESPTWQHGKEAVTVELQDSAPVGAVALSLARRVTDYPRHLIIELSTDARSWSRAWEGETAGLAYIAAVRDITRTRFTISFPPQTARFIRLRQTGRSLDTYWSIAEIDVSR